MNAQGFFNGNTGVLLMPGADEVSRRDTATVAVPYLQSIGVTKTQIAYVDSTNTGTLGQTSDAAVTAGKNANLNRVIVIGGARIAPVVLESQKAIGYKSQWSVGTYDDPYFLQQNQGLEVASLLVGQQGLGYAPAIDLGSASDPPVPDPTNPAQVQCVKIISAAGATPPGNLLENWTQVLQFCDGALFFKDVLDHLPSAATVTGAQFAAAAAQIGPTFHSSLTFGSQWGPGVYAGTDTAKALSWSATANNYVYGAPVTFSPTGVGGAAPTGASTAASTAAPTAASTPSSTVIPLTTITAPPNP
jgi:hypothetical protein